MSDLELDVPALHQLISVTQGDQDQSVLADTNQLRQQRLVDRDKHHHKQLWTKDPHGGQYRKVAFARKTEVTLQTIEPGYEKPKSGPTTNFVGNHMTQGAIDLVQAELSPPADHSLLLLKDTPYQQPDLIAIECHGPIAPEHKTISKYTWWDNGDFICVSVPTKALLLGSASHQAGNPAAKPSGSMVSAHESNGPCLLLTLRKADPNKTWRTLAGQAHMMQSVKQMPPSPESMAALRRALIQQRQQKQAKGMSARSACAATSWPVRPSGQVCMHLPEGVQAASCPSGSSAMSQSDLAQMTPVTAENGMVRGHGNEALLLQHRTSKFEAVEECNGAVACAQGLADVSMVESALRLRAVVYEQLEAYHLSLQDFCCILQLQPGNKAAQQGRCRLTAVVKKLQS
ncbi:MAG: hypothetical protein FRX49_04972 [Trebouxia sp. A1-2]|nr:MAG: hypothetical protein FRX49_04972 [Trebouxia sp. A1-2]